MSSNFEYEPLMSAKTLAALLSFGGKRPERAVYEMVYDGRIPKECIVQISERRFLFHPTRIRKIIDNGGFKKFDGKVSKGK